MEMNITQAELAGRSGVSLGSLRRFEGRVEISLRSLLELSPVLDELQAFSGFFQSRQRFSRSVKSRSPANRAEKKGPQKAMFMKVRVFLNHCGVRFLVGVLAETTRDHLFEYHPDFLDCGIPFFPYFLPLRAGTFFDQKQIFDGLFGVFDDSLPNGRRLLLLDRARRAGSSAAGSRPSG